VSTAGAAAIAARPPAARPLLIFPFNGNGLEAIDCLGSAFELLGFIDDTPSKQGRGAAGVPVMSRAGLTAHPGAAVLAVPGSAGSFRHRQSLVESLGIEPSRFARVVHPTARVSPLATVGRNVLIMAGVVVTSNAVIGDHVCVLPNTVVHHDAAIGSWSLVGSNVTIAGGVQIGENCYIGSGSSLMNGIAIGAGTLIGLGSNVIRSCDRGSTLAGNPARPIAQRGGVTGRS
jgi:sugar O-acyltransferase (sialic acid O-acetyltransferase NeuD family)